jgi:hypothetical protein
MSSHTSEGLLRRPLANAKAFKNVANLLSQLLLGRSKTTARSPIDYWESDE